MPWPGLRRARSQMFAASAVALAALVATAASAGAADPASPVEGTPAHSGAGALKAIERSATLATAGQSMWGAGNTSAPSDVTHTWFHTSWDRSGGFDAVTHVEFDPCEPIPLIPSCSIDFGRYGASLTGNTSGELGLSDTFHGATGGSVDVNYPMDLTFTAPADDSFAPGDEVTIRTQAPRPRPGASLVNALPSFDRISIDGRFRFHAGASGSICVGGCVGGTIFDFSLPGGGSTASGALLSLTKDQLLSIQGLGLGKCFGFAEGVLFGAATYPNSKDRCNNGTGPGHDNGYLAFPAPKIGGDGAGTSIAGTALSASASDQFVVVPISAVAWLAKLADLPTGFPNLSATFNGTGVSYTLFDEILTAIVSQTQELEFRPVVNASLDFGREVHYRVLDAEGTQTQSATGRVATFALGSTLEVVVPEPLDVTPTVSMGRSTFRNHTYDSLAGAAQTKALSLYASIGGCCSGIFPGIDINLGPVYDSGPQSLGSGTIGTLVDDTWELGGFGSRQLQSFSLVPDPPPVPTAKDLAPVEGAPFADQVVASFHDPDPADNGVAAADHYVARIDWGDGHTSDGTIAGTGGAFTVSGSNTYAEEGPYPVDVTVTDRSVPTVKATAHSHATVADAPLTVLSAPALDTVEGAPSPGGLVVATFADADPAGTVSDYSATIDWGDGQTSIGTVTAGPGSGFTVHAPSHTYEEEGTPPVRVTVRDEGGAFTVASPKMTTADAALHAGPPVTNGHLAGTGTPVLLWPNPGNAVVATFADDDPHGEVADFTAVISWGDGTSSAGVVAARAGGGFQVVGSHSYADAALGTRDVTIQIADAGGSRTTATTTVLAYTFADGGSFALGDRSYAAADPATSLTFWGAQWAKANAVTGGAPSSFKGFASQPPATPAPPATCPATRTFGTGPGNSPDPPATVPSYMAAMVTDGVAKRGPSITGTVTHWVVVHTQPGYAGSPGHAGAGTVVSELC